MNFVNRPNKCYQTEDGPIWYSRSVAVNLVLIVCFEDVDYVLASKRGVKSADFQGKWSVIAGYLDWNETLFDAVIRETWEEVGLNLPQLVSTSTKLFVNYDPYTVSSTPFANRQNVSVRYAMYLRVNSLPKLTVEYNEIPGEVEEPSWIPLNDVSKYEWAFNHDFVIIDALRWIYNQL